MSTTAESNRFDTLLGGAWHPRPHYKIAKIFGLQTNHRAHATPRFFGAQVMTTSTFVADEVDAGTEAEALQRAQAAVDDLVGTFVAMGYDEAVVRVAVGEVDDPEFNSGQPLRDPSVPCFEKKKKTMSRDGRHQIPSTLFRVFRTTFPPPLTPHLSPWIPPRAVLDWYKIPANKVRAGEIEGAGDDNGAAAVAGRVAHPSEGHLRDLFTDVQEVFFLCGFCFFL